MVGNLFIKNICPNSENFFFCFGPINQKQNPSVKYSTLVLRNDFFGLKTDLVTKIVNLGIDGVILLSEK